MKNCTLINQSLIAATLCLAGALAQSVEINADTRSSNQSNASINGAEAKSYSQQQSSATVAIEQNTTDAAQTGIRDNAEIAANGAHSAGTAVSQSGSAMVDQSAHSQSQADASLNSQMTMEAAGQQNALDFAIETAAQVAIESAVDAVIADSVDLSADLVHTTAGTIDALVETNAAMTENLESATEIHSDVSHDFSSTIDSSFPEADTDFGSQTVVSGNML